ncbi:P-loop NTPase fold protein [Chitinophaga varians]|uniref:P-loop NTPase fold protein n=1 Tax=Chitinophaga varians TaxID=2202339 RepID=UPI00165FABCD|nr:P-loop NTPase fold protein [Chitinophaga varians]MBC9909334.1 hypothetical protein [Chitinophaga varians]
MRSPIFQEIFNYPILEFEKHLTLDENERIFFSGRYGSGKTSFIKNYFDQEKIKQQYEVYHLFPVNYSISSNEDIMKYIKYDIILAMLEQHHSFPEESKSYLRTLPKFMLKRMDKVLEAIIAMVPEVGKSILDMYEKLGNLKDEYLAYHDDENKSDGDKLAEYLDLLEGKAGSLVENDVITKIISGKIASNKPKKSVLVLDDLDRLDPEHVFRILNVFAAHFDAKNSSRGPNKFGFDKVVIVSDIDNIRNIFLHRYGALADFTGYIDKFYSTDIYHFDNRAAVAKITDEIISSYTTDGKKEEAQQLYFRDGWLRAIISLLLEKGDLSLRSILNTYTKNLTYHKEEVDLGDYNPVNVWRVPMIHKLKYLTELLGGANGATIILEKLKRESIKLEFIMLYAGNLLYILNYTMIESNPTDPIVISYKNKKFILEAERDIGYDRNIINRVQLYTTSYLDNTGEYLKSNEYVTEPKEFWELAITTINRLQVLGYLK